MNFLSFPALRRIFSCSFSLYLTTAFFGAGCRKEEINTYEIPKGAETPKVMAAAPAPTLDESAPAQMKFKTPEGWQQVTPDGQALAQFSVANHQAEFSVMSFAGKGLSQLTIVNIVREKAKLAPFTEKEMAKVIEPVAVGNETGSLVDLSAAIKTETNDSPNGVMVTVIPHGEATYFFKLSGKAAIVGAQKPAMLEFLKSVSFTAGDSGAPVAMQQTVKPVAQDLPPAEAAPQAQEPIAHDPGLPTWDVPAGWTEVPPTEMLLAKFTVTKSQGAVDVTISSFPGDVGGTLANVNRWRGMVKLPSIGSSDLEKIISSVDVIGGKATLVDFAGQGARSGKPSRLIGVIWPRNGQTWFYKLMGDSAVADSEKAAFLKFVQSVRYPQ